MSTHASGKNRKRATVRAALKRHKVFVSTRRYSGRSGMTSARVIIEGEAYEVNGNQLRLLVRGRHRPISFSSLS